MAPLHPLVDRIKMNNRCYQKVGVPSRHGYLAEFRVHFTLGPGSKKLGFQNTS